MLFHYLADCRGPIGSCSAGEQMEQIAMCDHAYELSVLIFDRNVTHPSPVHDAGGQIDQIVRTHGEQISGHELAHGLIALEPFGTFRSLLYCPFMHWLALLLFL